jgi:hypothetical protein
MNLPSPPSTPAASHLMVALLCLSLLAGCQSAMSTPTTSPYDSAPVQGPPTPPVVTTGELAPTGDPGKAAQMNIRPPEWPLRFKRHNFGARCFDTLDCSVAYDNFEHGGYDRHKPTRSSASYGPDYLKGWNGSYGGIDNFPPPAKVSWISKDGTRHEADIDIGDLFKDQVVLHHVPREELADLPDGKYNLNPSILLEVNDRTIRIYMAARIATKHLQIPGNQYSSARYDLVLVKTYTF